MRRAGLLDAIRAACWADPSGEAPDLVWSCPVELRVGLPSSPAFDDCPSTPGGGRPLEYAAKLAVVVFVAFCSDIDAVAGLRRLPAAIAADLAPEESGFAVEEVLGEAVGRLLKACCAAPRIASEGLLTPTATLFALRGMVGRHGSRLSLIDP